MALNTDWREFLELLASCDVEFLVVGAWARAFHGEPRTTGDIDFWIRTSPENASKVLDVISRYGFSSLGLTMSDLVGGHDVIQLGYPPRRIDLLTKLTALDFDDAWKNRVSGEIDGIPVSYLSREDFIANKRAVGRAKDLADVDAVSQK